MKASAKVVLSWSIAVVVVQAAHGLYGKLDHVPASYSWALSVFIYLAVGYWIAQRVPNTSWQSAVVGGGIVAVVDSTLGYLVCFAVSCHKLPHINPFAELGLIVAAFVCGACLALIGWLIGRFFSRIGNVTY